MTLIAITGYKNSGKNAVCNVLHNDYGFKITGFADILKSMLLAIDPWMGWSEAHGSIVRVSVVVRELGWDVAKEQYPEVRRLLQKLGTEGARDHLGEDVWVNAWSLAVNNLLEAGYDVCVSDMRFLNEARAVRELDGQIWRVTRPGTTSGTHLSENQLDLIDTNYTVHNDGRLVDLTYIVKNLMSL